MWSFIKNKDSGEVWITYAINRKTKQVIGLTVGSKTKNDIRPIIEKLKLKSPKRIVTDGFPAYPKLVKPVHHDKRKYQNNRIERANLTLRQHIKRLSRRTLSFSKSKEMLEATLMLYLFWNAWRIGSCKIR